METATKNVSSAGALSREPAHMSSLAARLAGLLPGLAAAAVMAGLGLKHGGYFATAWGPMTLVFLGVAAAALTFRPRNVAVRALVLPGLLALLMVWVLASSAWGSPSEAVPEARRTLLYVSAALALALVLRRGATIGVLIGMWAGTCVVCLYALATRLFPEEYGAFDSIAGYRLSEPVGYWNALGLLAVLGLLLAFGLVAHSRQLFVRLVAGASTVAVGLTCYFTFSRGAWLALTIGVISALALDPRRLRLALALIVVGPWAAAAVLVGSSSGPLTESGRHTLAAAAEDGRALAAVGVGLALCAAGTVALLAALEARISIAPTTRRACNAAILVALPVVVVAALLAVGGPTAISDSFGEQPRESEQLNERLFTLSSNGRAEQWRVAFEDISENPVLGSGAGSFKRFWLEHRPRPATIRDAHSLYVETLAELGPIGLVLIVAILGFPLALALRFRHRPGVPIAAAALIAYAVHAGVDWDWEFPVLTLVALACAAAIVAEATDTPRVSDRLRVGLLAAILLMLPVVGVMTLGSRAEAASAEAFDEGQFARSAKEAKRAERLAPWSAEPLVLLGRAQAAGGELARARATFERAVAREPDHWRAWYELASVSKGRNRAAAVRRAEALNPLQIIQDLEESL